MRRKDSEDPYFHHCNTLKLPKMRKGTMDDTLQSEE